MDRHRPGPCRGSGGLSHGLTALLLFTSFATFAGSAPARAAGFVRGDTDDSGTIELTDGVRVFRYLYLGAPLTCLDAADADDSGRIELTDGIRILRALFQGGVSIAPPSTCGPDPTPDDLDCALYSPCGGPIDSARDLGHVLNRLAYGPSPSDLEHVLAIGADAYIEEQLAADPSLDTGNTALAVREGALLTDVPPSRDTVLVAAGTLWRYRKGTSEPPADWKTPDFDDSSWEMGLSGIGYGDGDDQTVLEDMRGSYLSVYMRHTFQLADPSSVDSLFLRADYDDGFAAHLNGVEVLRRNLTGNPPRFNTAASSHEATGAEEFDITARKDLLQAGANVLAVQVHNATLDSSDLSMIPELVTRELLPGPSRRVINGIAALQELVHVRGVYSRRQLQTVLAEFWENHFTTDYDKVAEYLDALQNSDATDAMSTAQAAAEAAQLEYLEYQFWTDHALGYFGDMLLFSATSPAQLIYLDNVLNVKAEPNENYAREILELFAFGVDNRYTQRDIEELARAFTGWSICKVDPAEAPSFPESSIDPPTECGVQFEDTEVLGLGPGWRYFKGTEEPAPGAGGEPTADWALPAFDDSAWLSGSTGIGYGDGDDATVLSDMRGGYLSVYLRRPFEVTDPWAFRNLILAVQYDDAFVAYLNGVEVARSENLEDRGSPPPFDARADENHEVEQGTEYFNLNRFLPLLQAGSNLLAIQVHNVNLDSSDLSMLPRLLDREIFPGSIENGDRGGVWTFRFNPSEHDTGAKVLFQGTPYQINLPAGRTGAAGVRDALDVIEAMVNHPSAAEFISIKLIQKLVSDGITLQSFRDGTAPPELRELLADAVAAWNSTTPKGHVETVLRAILSPGTRSSHFWNEAAYDNKVKTAVEYINSTLRALDADATGQGLPAENEAMGMHLFTREDPDGWSELGFDWMDTGTMLARVNFAQALAENRSGDFGWATLPYLDGLGLDTAEEIVDHFNDFLFQGRLPAASQDILVEFVTTDTSGNPLPFSRARGDFGPRVEELVGLMLSLPEWHFQ